MLEMKVKLQNEQISVCKGGMIMLTVYCYDKCTTCKKAIKWLDDRNISYDKKDIKTDHPDEKTLRKLWQASGLPLKRFFNTSGMIYREMELSKKLPNMGEDEQIKLLASDGMLVERPLAVGDGYVMVGFKEAEWKERF